MKNKKEIFILGPGNSLNNLDINFFQNKITLGFSGQFFFF